jgi:tetratricopeptide (TPR) repeat protein
MRYLIPLILISSSCFLRIDKTPIGVPEIDDSYYRNSIEVLEEAIQEQPDYLPFIELQLSYYERLGWPSEARKAIVRAEKNLLNDQVFFNQKIAFYRASQDFQQLAEELKKYPVSGQLPLDLKLTYSDALIRMNDSINARSQLLDLMVEQDTAVISFVAEGLQRLGDTTMALHWIFSHRDWMSEKLLDVYRDQLLWDSIVGLVAYELDLFSESNNRQLLARSYFEIDSLEDAEQILVEDTTMEGKALLVEVYEKQFKLLSASRVLDELIVIHPDNIEWLKKRGELADRRGFFEAALFFYNQAINIDSTDQEATQQIGQINQKIAYLRQQQQEQQITPMLGIDSLKKGM